MKSNDPVKSHFHESKYISWRRNCRVFIGIIACRYRISNQSLSLIAEFTWRIIVANGVVRLCASVPASYILQIRLTVAITVQRICTGRRASCGVAGERRSIFPQHLCYMSPIFEIRHVWTIISPVTDGLKEELQFAVIVAVCQNCGNVTRRIAGCNVLTVPTTSRCSVALLARLIVDPRCAHLDLQAMAVYAACGGLLGISEEGVIPSKGVQ